MSTRTLNGGKTIMGKWYGTPTELWGFRVQGASRSAVGVAERFLGANQDRLGLRGVQLEFGRPRLIESLGASHVILRQRVQGIPVYRAYVTVHLSRDGDVYLVKSRAVPIDFAKPEAPFAKSRAQAVRLAVASVATQAGGRGVRAIDRVDRVWYPHKTKTRPMALRPAYKVHLLRPRPRADWIILIDGATGRVLQRYDNLAEATGVSRVFDPNPVIALRGSEALVGKGGRLLVPPPEAYATVRLGGLRKSGFLDGRRVSTRATRNRVVHRDRRFEFPSTSPGFEEVMVYFHIDRAVHYLESLGFNGRRAIFRAPIVVNARGTREDNSSYSPHDRSLMFGIGAVDDAEDAEIILHELGHAIQDAICPQFGQSDEAAAIGEGFGDYFAASFFAAKKPAPYRFSVGTWDGLQDAEGDPPCVRRVDVPLTYEQFDHGADADEHQNGQIWSATLWDIWTAVTRDVADRIILESHFQLDGFTTFACAARAILDADRNLYRGRHTSTLREIFHRRGIGPVV